MKKETPKYTVRVYAVILIDNKVLISDEYHENILMTKLPGGGMEIGEGTLDCLKREAIEEFEQEIEIIEHLYTTDFYQISTVINDKQIIAIYYTAKLTDIPKFKISNKKNDFELKNGSVSFRLVPISKLKPDMFTWKIDQKAIETFINQRKCKL